MLTKKLKTVSLYVMLISGLALLIVSCKKNPYEGSGESIQPQEDYETLPDQSDEIFMIDGSPVIVKKIEDKYYIANDVMLSEQQVNTLRLADNKELGTDERATVTTSLKRLWTNGTVYYKISDAAKKNDILNAMSTISATVPSIKFVERTTQSNYCDFVSSNVNSSYIGMIGGRQPINLFNRQEHVIIHEILHALGFEHEQTHPERDKYVSLHLENAQRGSEFNFQISSNSKGVGEFDFKSIMLYDSYGFSANGRPVITKLDGSTFSGGTELSAGDIAGLEHLYGGNTTDPTPPAPPTPPGPTTPPNPPTPPTPPTTGETIQSGRKYVIAAKAGDKVLDINSSNSAIALNNEANGKTSQQWIAVEVLKGIWVFESAAQDNLVLEISNNRYQGYNMLKANNYRGASRQLFRIAKNADNSVTITPYANPYAALYAVSSQTGREGAPVVLYFNSQLNNQKFVLVPQN